MSDLKKQLCENDLSKFVCCTDHNNLINCCFYNPVTNEACCPPKYIELNVDWFTKNKELLCCIDESAFPICLENINYDPTPLLTTNDCGFEVFNPNNIVYSGNFCAYKGLIVSRSEKEACLKPPTEIFVVFKKFCYLTYGSTNCDPSCGFYVPPGLKTYYRWQCQGTPPYQTCEWVPHTGPCSDYGTCFTEDCRQSETLQQCLDRIFCEKEPSLCGYPPPNDYLLEVPCVLDKSKINNVFLSITIAIPSKNIYFVDVKEIDYSGNNPFKLFPCINLKDPNTGEIIHFDLNVSGQACLVPPEKLSSFSPNEEFEVDTCHYTDKDYPDITFRSTYLEYQITKFSGCACPDCDRKCAGCCSDLLDENKIIEFIEVELSGFPEDNVFSTHSLNNQLLVFYPTKIPCEFGNISNAGGLTCRRTYYIKTPPDRSCYYAAEEAFCFTDQFFKFISKLIINTEQKYILLTITAMRTLAADNLSCVPVIDKAVNIHILFQDESFSWKCLDFDDKTFISTRISFTGISPFDDYIKKFINPINLKLKIRIGDLKCLRTTGDRYEIDIVKGKQKVLVDPIAHRDFQDLKCMNGFLHDQRVYVCYNKNDFIGSKLVKGKNFCPDDPTEYITRQFREKSGPYILHAGQYLISSDRIRSDFTQGNVNVSVGYVELFPPEPFPGSTFESLCPGKPRPAGLPSDCVLMFNASSACDDIVNLMYPPPYFVCTNISGIYPLYCQRNILIDGNAPNFLNSPFFPDSSPDLLDPDTGCTPYSLNPLCDLCSHYSSKLYRSILYFTNCDQVLAYIPYTYRIIVVQLGSIPTLSYDLFIDITLERSDPLTFYKCRLCKAHGESACYNSRFSGIPFGYKYFRSYPIFMDTVPFLDWVGDVGFCSLRYYSNLITPTEITFQADRPITDFGCPTTILGSCPALKWRPASITAKFRI